MIRVLVVDDSASVRAFITRALDLVGDIEVVGQCSDGTQAAATAAAVRPDVVLMDLHMPNLSGIEATRILSEQQPAARVIIWTADPATSAALADAAAAGAVGFQVKTGNLVDLAAAVRAAASGGTAWPWDANS